VIRKAARFSASVVAPVAWRLYLRENARKWPRGAPCAVTLSFDYDYVSDVACIPELCDLFDSFSLPSSHAVVGKYVERFKREHARLVDRGDEVMNHTYSHPDGPLNPDEKFNGLGAKRMEEEIAGCEKACERVLGVKPVGFRTPHFGNLNSQQVYGLLEKRGYLYSSSTNLTTTQSRGVPYHPNKRDFRKAGAPHYKLLELPVFSCPTHYYPVFDSWHCFESKAHYSHGDFHATFAKALRLAERYGSYLNLYFDPRHVAGTKDLEKILETAKHSRAWVATSRQVAEWWLK